MCIGKVCLDNLLDISAPASLSLRFFVALRERFIFAVVYCVIFVSFVYREVFLCRLAAKRPSAESCAIVGRGGRAAAVAARARAVFADLHFKSRDILFIGSRDVRQMIPPTPSTIFNLGLVGCASRYLIFCRYFESVLPFVSILFCDNLDLSINLHCRYLHSRKWDEVQSLACIIIFIKELVSV